MCELLLEAEADQDHIDRSGRTPLWAAASMGHAGLTAFLQIFINYNIYNTYKIYNEKGRLLPQAICTIHPILIKLCKYFKHDSELFVLGLRLGWAFSLSCALKLVTI